MATFRVTVADRSLMTVTPLGALASTRTVEAPSEAELNQLDAYWRTANYMALGMIYLQDNPLLREPLRPKHILAICNQIDRFNLVIDVIDRVKCLGSRAAHVKEQMRDEIFRHVAYAHEHGIDAPEINEWRWSLGHSSCSIDRKS